MLITAFLMNINAVVQMKSLSAVNVVKQIAVSRQNVIHLEEKVNEMAGSKVIWPFHY